MWVVIIYCSIFWRLVDSRDIAELKLKQLGCELIIRKKEALLQPPSAAPPTPTPLVQSHYMPAIQPSALPSSVPAPPPVPGPAQAPLPQKTKPSESSLPPLKCPMAGTFYRSPGPSEPPFVKVVFLFFFFSLFLHAHIHTWNSWHEWNFNAGWRQSTEGTSFVHYWGHEIDEWNWSKHSFLILAS